MIRNHYMYLFWFFLTIFITTKQVTSNYEITSSSLPEKNYMPTMANGHLGALVMGDSILINGVYNGFMGYSHRARIPNFGNILFNPCNNETVEQPSACLYTLDTRLGEFRITYEDQFMQITQKVFAHRYYNRVLVNRFEVTRKPPSTAVINIELSQNEGPESQDIIFNRSESFAPDVIYIEGRTVNVEDPKYQKEHRPVSVLYNIAPSLLQLLTTENEKIVHYYTIVGLSEAEVKQEYSELLEQTDSIVYQRHIDEWEKLWTDMEINVIGNDNLDLLIHTSMYGLFSSLPSMDTFQPAHTFYGLSPSGLGKGGMRLSEYQGHSFWDTEIWMQPPILLLNPKWSKDLIHYRYVTRMAAADHARETKQSGYRYPWETAYTGREVTPECCPETVKYQHHITADIAFAIRSHLFATHDFDWFADEGCELAYKTAEFWLNRVSYDSTTRLYDINEIMGPDEDIDGVNNNAYSNVNAGYNLYFGEFARCFCQSVLGKTEYNTDEPFETIAKQIKLIYDEELDYHPQYEGFDKDNTLIKQADTVLLGYPLQYPMEASTKMNNLRIYSNITRNTGPAMTWAMHVIGYLDIDEIEEATNVFGRSYQPYIRAPYNVWSENIEGEPSAGNFITGAGGFLQLIINGYGGFRLHMDYAELYNARLPPGTTNLKFSGITYLGNIFEIEINEIITSLRTVNTIASESKPFTILIDDIEQDAQDTYEIVFGQKLTIKPVDYEFGECTIPENRIGISGDANDDGDGGANIMHTSNILILTILIFSVIIQLF